MVRYALTIFLSAFLLFQVQPLIGKFILPWFGGSPAVWTSCMLFFQVFLLGGYAYAHGIARRLSPRNQTIVHVGLLALSLAFLPIAPDAAVWKQSVEEAPIARILALLAVTIGLPYLLLSSTGPLLQETYRRETGHTPYRLYSLSNIGSLLALLSYPFAFEPMLTLRTQIWGWSAGYALFAGLCAWCTIGYWRAASAPDGDEAALATTVTLHRYDEGSPPTWRDVLLWLSLAACGSVMLLATTNQVCQEITAVPFLWVLPLALYLTTFIICFDHERWYHRGVFLALLVLAVLAACYAILEGNNLNMYAQMAAYSSALWVSCMVCHGELVRAKPAAQHATLFYLMVSAGGAIGGVLVALAAPLLLPDFWEYHIALVATVVLAFLATYHAANQGGVQRVPGWILGGGLSLTVGMALGWVMTLQQYQQDSGEVNLETSRNFYGVLRVNSHENAVPEGLPVEYENVDRNGPKRELIHGRIQHGFQYLDPEKRDWPTSYYGHPSGVGIAIDQHPRRIGAGSKNLRIGVIGLGCGTLASYGKPGDVIRYYEINSAVIRISDEFFFYRQDSQADVQVVLGDARIQMEQELAADQPQQFDVLAVDAFSSDSIPMHLLTAECMEIYRRHLKPDGLLCLHISNRYLNLNGVARGGAQVLGWEAARINSDGDNSLGLDAATWVIVTGNRAFLDAPEVRLAVEPWNENDRPPLVWTDDYGSLWQTLGK